MIAVRRKRSGIEIGLSEVRALPLGVAGIKINNIFWAFIFPAFLETVAKLS
jgi:hypothetical protein